MIKEVEARCQRAGNRVDGDERRFLRKLSGHAQPRRTAISQNYSPWCCRNPFGKANRRCGIQPACYCPSSTRPISLYWHRHSWHIAGWVPRSTRAWDRAPSYANSKCFPGWGWRLSGPRSGKSSVGKGSMLMLTLAAFRAALRRYPRNTFPFWLVIRLRMG